MPQYAEVAVHRLIGDIEKAFDYHIPPELDGSLQPGHLVEVSFRTGREYGIVLAVRDHSDIAETKPVLERLDPRPVLTEAQIELARWLSRTYLAPIGDCLWLLLPPGLASGRDTRVTLLKPDYLTPDALEMQLIALLQKRGSRRGAQLDQALPGRPWRAAVDALVKAGAVSKESILAPSRVRPKVIQTAALAVHPDEIPDAFELGKALAGERRWHVLKLLARDGEPMDVSWIYAQTDAKLEDLKKLEEHGLVALAEKQTWRDSLAGREFVPTSPPPLTPDQSAVWERIRRAIERITSVSTPIPVLDQNPTPNPSPLAERGEDEGFWITHPGLWGKLKPLARQMRRQATLAEDALWNRLRHKQVSGYKFRRQHPIERFIVDFYCREARLIIEVDGEIHEYTKDEDAVRQEFLENLGFRVVRFTNDEVFQNLESVIERIAKVLQEPSLLSPLSAGGEGSGVGLNTPTEGPGVGLSVPTEGSGVGLNAPPQEPGVGLNVPPQEPGLGFYAPPQESGLTFNSRVFLLHGVTGSGKTEIYLRAIAETLAQGRQAIFLVPEIALTPQTIRRVAARFTGKVAIVHSQLSDGERYDTWRRARDGLVQVVVGPRSALFTPLPDVGLIVMDEEHDQSYKHSEPMPPPYYHVRQVAEEMMRRNDGALILGSATPDVETMFRAERGDIELLELPSRIMGHRVRISEQSEHVGVLPLYQPADAEDALMIDLPPVEVVDMRSELKAGNVSIFSRRLQTALAGILARREQAILFMNRRGQSTYVFCRDCGYVAACKRCDTPLTYHREGQALRCHRCGLEQPQPQICPVCKSKRIKYFGAGTQQVEQTLIELFPNVRVARWDGDTAETHEDHEAILQRFIERRADVMIGTQMVAKGLDLPLVTLVGVVSADMGLALPDFRAGERTFQLLTQVAGRAGRGLLGGEVVLQTYRPEHYAIAAASKHDYDQFYEQEIVFRRDLGYPPFRRLLRIIFRADNEVKAHDLAEQAANLLRRRLETLDMTGTDLIGPAPCFFTRVNREFRWHVLLNGPDPTMALRGLDIPRDWTVDVDPVNIL